MSARSFSFSSESVTEGHPDKIADQISDGVLDAVLRDDPEGRVACETLITTGLVVVAGEITTTTYVDIPRLVRKTVAEIGYTRAKYGFDAETCGVIVALDEQSPDIAAGVDESFEVQHGDVDPIDRIGAGDQGMMFGYASNETRGADAAADPARPQDHPSAGRDPQGRRAPVPAPGREGASDCPLRGRRGRPPAPGRDRARPHLDAASRRPRRRDAHQARPDRPRPATDPAARALRRAPLRGAGLRLRQPDGQVRDRRADGRHGPDRAQDHRRHLRRRGAPRRRRLLGQGSDEGRPLGRLRRAVRGEERRGRRSRRALPDPGRLRHRRRAPAERAGRLLRRRTSSRRRRSRGSSASTSTCGRARSSAISTCAARSTSARRPTATSAARTADSRGSGSTRRTPFAPPPVCALSIRVDAPAPRAAGREWGPSSTDPPHDAGRRRVDTARAALRLRRR